MKFCFGRFNPKVSYFKQYSWGVGGKEPHTTSPFSTLQRMLNAEKVLCTKIFMHYSTVYGTVSTQGAVFSWSPAQPGKWIPAQLSSAPPSPAQPSGPAAHAQVGRARACPMPLRPPGGAGDPAAAASRPARPGRRRPPRRPQVRLRRAEGVGSRLPEAAAAARSRAGVRRRSCNERRPEAVTCARRPDRGP